MNDKALLVTALLMSAAPGCNRESPQPPAAESPPAPVLANRQVRKALPAEPPGPAAVDAAPPAAAVVEHPKTCEVEVRGQIKIPPKAAKGPAPLTFVAIGDCLARDPYIIGYGGSSNGGFFVEVFAPWGSDLSICAAVEPKPGAPSVLYGKWPKPMHAEATGEVEFGDVVIELAPGPPKTFPHRNGPR